MHVLVDIWDCDKQVLADEAGIASLLQTCVQDMGMAPLGDTVTHKVGGPNPGVTGFQVITESHLSIHTFSDWGTAWLDLFSCKDFDGDALVRSVLAALGGKLAEYQVVARGFNVLEPRRGGWWQVRPPQEEA